MYKFFFLVMSFMCIVKCPDSDVADGYIEIFLDSASVIKQIPYATEEELAPTRVLILNSEYEKLESILEHPDSLTYQAIYKEFQELNYFMDAFIGEFDIVGNTIKITEAKVDDKNMLKGLCSVYLNGKQRLLPVQFALTEERTINGHLWDVRNASEVRDILDKFNHFERYIELFKVLVGKSKSLVSVYVELSLGIEDPSNIEGIKINIVPAKFVTDSDEHTISYHTAEQYRPRRYSYHSYGMGPVKITFCQPKSSLETINTILQENIETLLLYQMHMLGWDINNKPLFIRTQLMRSFVLLAKQANQVVINGITIYLTDKLIMRRTSFGKEFEYRFICNDHGDTRSVLIKTEWTEQNPNETTSKKFVSYNILNKNGNFQPEKNELVLCNPSVSIPEIEQILFADDEKITRLFGFDSNIQCNLLRSVTEIVEYGQLNNSDGSFKLYIEEGEFKFPSIR